MRDFASVQKLQKMFDERFEWILFGGRPPCLGEDFMIPEEKWTVYMNHLDCLVVDIEDLDESFDEMVNYGEAVRTHTCLRNPSSRGFVLVPPELAEKCLVLGGVE